MAINEVVKHRLNPNSLSRLQEASMWAGYFVTGETATALGRALVEERYAALRRQIPLVYVLALVNVFSLQLATAGGFNVGFNPPTAFLICAGFRSANWCLARRDELSVEKKLAHLRQTNLVALLTCLAVCSWFLTLMQADPRNGLAVMLFGALTAIGTAYGLSSSPVAARIPLLFLALPLSGGALVWHDAHYLGAGASLGVAATLLIPLLEAHNRRFVGLVESRSLVAHERARAEQAAREAQLSATTDFLTGLMNRRAFMGELEKELRGGKNFAVGLLDLDRFKPMNDTFGHAAGDELLQTVAKRLTEAMASSGFAARLGGDEFGILIRDRDAAEVLDLGEHLLAQIGAPALINGRHFTISGCVGLAFAREGGGASPSSLLSNADVALYRAKTQAECKVLAFEPSMAAPARRRAHIEGALRLPGVIDEMQILYQPIVDLRTGRVLSLEALARWKNAGVGEIRPSEFLPIAEQLNVIGGLSDKLIGQAVDEALSWPEAIRLSVNLSAVQLSSPNASQTVLRGLEQRGFSPRRLQVEVTETALMADFTRARENLQALRSAGVTLVLDDFGAGHASISSLREMVFDEIKLDGSLLVGADIDPERQRLLAAVISFCTSLRLKTVAEHIESQDQLAVLKRLGCGAGQGYFLHRPMPASMARKLLNEAAPPIRADSSWKRSAA